MAITKQQYQKAFNLLADAKQTAKDNVHLYSVLPYGDEGYYIQTKSVHIANESDAERYTKEIKKITNLISKYNSSRLTKADYERLHNEVNSFLRLHN